MDQPGRPAAYKNENSLLLKELIERDKASLKNPLAKRRKPEDPTTSPLQTPRRSSKQDQDFLPGAWLLLSIRT
jgi:hypothetical protein